MSSQVALQFELAMGLTGTLDATQMLEDFARTLLRRLYLRGVVAFERDPATGGFTRRCAAPLRYEAEIEADAWAALAGEGEAVMLPMQARGGTSRYLVSLPRYGAMVFDRTGPALPEITLRALQPLLTRCGHLLRASLDREAGARRERILREQQFASVLGALREAVIAVDGTGRIRIWNEGATRLFGADAAQMIGSDVQHMVTGEFVTSNLTVLAHRLAEGEDQELGRLLELTARRADGTLVPVELMVSRVTVAEAPLFVAVLRDISERRAAEAERAAQRQLQEQTNAELREERDRLDALLSSSSAILYAARLSDSKVDFVSASAKEVLGFTVEEMCEPGFWMRAVHPEDLPRVLGVVTGATGDRYVNEYRHRTATGDYRWLRDHVRILRDAAGAPARVVGTSFDITQRKRVERRVEGLLAMQRVVVELSSAFLRDPVETHDAAMRRALQDLGTLTRSERAYIFRLSHGTASNTHEWCAPGVSPQIDALQDIPQSELGFFVEALHARGTLHIPAVSQMPDDLAAGRDFLAAQGIERLVAVALQREGQVHGFISLDNPEFEPLEAGDVIDLLRLFADELIVGLRSVEERNLRETLLQQLVEKHDELSALNSQLESRVRERTSQLAESDARFERLFEHAPQAMLLMNDAGEVLRANLRAGELFGVPAEALTRDDLGRILEGLGDSGANASPTPAQRRDGSGFWAEVRREPMRFGGETRLLVGVSDVTERVRRQQATEEELREKEMLLQEIHHRVKNNLQIVSSLLMLQRARVADPALRAMLEESVSRVRSMALVHQQLYAERAMTQIDLGGYARTLAHSIRATLTSTARVVVEAEAGVSVPMEQAVSLGLLLNELVTNALKHGVPTEPMAPPEQPWDVRISVRREGARLCLAVENHGRPLPATVDWRTANSLGLHLVRSLARQLRASLEVHTQPCTRFELAFTPEADAAAS